MKAQVKPTLVEQTAEEFPLCGLKKPKTNQEEAVGSQRVRRTKRKNTRLERKERRRQSPCLKRRQKDSLENALLVSINANPKYNRGQMGKIWCGTQRRGGAKIFIRLPAYNGRVHSILASFGHRERKPATSIWVPGFHKKMPGQPRKTGWW